MALHNREEASQLCLKFRGDEVPMPIDELSSATERPEVRPIIFRGLDSAEWVFVYGLVHHNEDPVGPQDSRSLREGRSDLREIVQGGVAYRYVKGT